MNVLSSAEKEAIQNIIDFGSETFGFETTRVIDLVLVLVGEREGCLFTVTEKNEAEFLDQQLSSANVPFEQVNKAGLYMFFIAHSESHLSNYDLPGDGSVEGPFFGYPDEAVEFYCSSDDPVTEFDEFIRNNCIYSLEDWKTVTPLVEYIPAPNKESLEKALHREEKYEKVLQSVSIDLSNVHNLKFVFV